MIINMNMNLRQTNEYSDRLTKEQRAHALTMMAKQFCELLERSPDENLYWTESTTDLMDISHEVYLTEMLVDSQGRPMAFGKIVSRACAVLHVVRPSNPYSMAFNARNRKGVRQTSFFSRYCWLMFSKRSGHPLNGMVRQINNL